MNIKFSDSKPDEPGFYVWRRGKGGTPVLVRVDDGVRAGLYAMESVPGVERVGGYMLEAMWNGEWSQRLEIP
jgi:hypothetical protein